MHPNTVRGATLMSLAMASFGVNDALTKLAIGDMNPAQLTAVRSGLAAIVLIALALRQGEARNLGRVVPPLVGLRIVGELGGTLSYVMALSVLPLTSASAIFNALPIAVALGAVVVFGERLGWRGYAAVLVGFVGVLVVIRPGMDVFNPNAGWALLAVLFCSVRDLATARIPALIGTTLISATTSAALAVCGGLLIVPFGGWSPMSPTQWLLVGCASLSVVAGYLFLINSLRVGATAVVSMFRYTYLVFTVTLGSAVFEERVDGATAIGIALIVAAGLILIERRRVAR